MMSLAGLSPTMTFQPVKSTRLLMAPLRVQVASGLFARFVIIVMRPPPLRGSGQGHRVPIEPFELVQQILARLVLGFLDQHEIADRDCGRTGQGKAPDTHRSRGRAGEMLCDTGVRGYVLVAGADLRGPAGNVHRREKHVFGVRLFADRRDRRVRATDQGEGG